MRSTLATFLSRHFCGWLLSTVLLIALVFMGLLSQLLPYWLVLVLIVLVRGGSLDFEHSKPEDLKKTTGLWTCCCFLAFVVAAFKQR